MSRRSLAFAITVVAAAAALPALASQATCPSVAPPPLAFSPPSYIDTQRAGGEPVSVVAQDGAIVVSAHAGTTHLYKDPAAAPGAGDFLVGYTNQTLNWRSADGGDTWRYIGTAGAPAGAHSPTSTGFSDPDLTIDEGGRIYNVEIDLANVSVFSSTDDGQSFPYANAIAASGDRPWLTGQQADEVFLVVNAFIGTFVFRSTDGGITWAVQTDDAPVDGKLWNDPLDPERGLIGPVYGGFAISSDQGKTWRRFDDARLGQQTAFFEAIAVDRGGTVYAASAGGYNQAGDAYPTGEVWFDWFDRTTKRWGGGVKIPTPAGDALWPWIDAGDDGRAVVVWYQNHAGRPNEFYIYAAYTLNAHGSTVTCSDGREVFVPPVFSVANASGRPVHVGHICLNGTSCNASSNHERSDRRLGDFFTVNHDLDGRIFIVSGDTMLPSPAGGPKPVANPIFLRQAAGAPLLETPVAPRPTRCMTPVPEGAPPELCRPWG